MSKKLKQLSCRVYEDEAAEQTKGNMGSITAYLVGELPGSPMLSAHMHWVGNGCRVKPLIENGRIVSDGRMIQCVIFVWEKDKRC